MSYKEDFGLAIGQPVGQGSTILFSGDMDCSAREIDGPILDYFEAIQQTIGSAFAIGAYGSGAVLSKLLAEKQISVPSGFPGTQAFFTATNGRCDRSRRNNDTFDYAENHAEYNSHSDIVVEVRDNVVRVMGGCWRYCLFWCRTSGISTRQ
ncbi:MULTISPECIES: glycoside hydrolase domain-containing protein [Enterobacterales]|uniref:glycoside hydrolase domain-containing protein n=1 Tax=Enterobacterales TaxID=91347 RepID=UPI002ED7CE5D